VGEHSPVRVDHNMKTTLDGLYAIGNACYVGSSMVGAVPTPGRIRGSGLTGAIWMGIRGGESAARYAADVAMAEPDAAQTEACKAATFAPIGRSAGVHPTEVVHAVHKAYHPVGYSLHKSKERMEEALGMVLEVKRSLPQMAAPTGTTFQPATRPQHGADAEVFYRTSLARTESRGWHIREDLPGARTILAGSSGSASETRMVSPRSPPRTSQSPGIRSNREGVSGRLGDECQGRPSHASSFRGQKA